jgi:hypothetical protein
MHVMRIGPGMAVALGLLTAVGVSGCTASTAPASAPATASRASATASGEVQNLIVSAAVRSELIAAYAALRHIPTSDMYGVPGSVYYAYQRARGTYWALAKYEPVSSDPQAVTVGFQDGGSDGFFKRTGSGPWQVSLGGEPEACTQPRFFPQPVLAAWALLPTATPPAGC